LPRDAATGEAKRPEGDKRLDGANPFGDSLFTPRNWKIVDELKRVSAEAAESPARVALMGVSRPEQVSDNAAALDVALSAEHRAALDAVSASADTRMLYSLFTRGLRQYAVFGGSSVDGWETWSR